MAYHKIKVIGVISAALLLVFAFSHTASAGLSITQADAMDGKPCPRGQKYEGFTRIGSGGIPTGDVRCVKDDSYTPFLSQFSALDIILISATTIVASATTGVVIYKLTRKKQE